MSKLEVKKQVVYYLGMLKRWLLKLGQLVEYYIRSVLVKKICRKRALGLSFRPVFLIQ